jgi:hypothetical protein
MQSICRDGRMNRTMSRPDGIRPSMPGTDTAGSGWRAASWMFLILAGVMHASGPEYDGLTMDGLRAIFGDILGVGFAFAALACGLAGAARAAEVNDRRFLVMLPVWASFVYLLVFLAIRSAP